ncbi:YdgA family protein [Pusillimonas minor]|uniref:YdgA family protein n=1 Tax=Pusillimonas minor TaxID=2697024 RepID=A0A842HM49_9BURK|nr:YdgA family protein [Pusillimonas minor]MBC2768618.1 YdgA family protein [Pusillimonas minor]
MKKSVKLVGLVLVLAVAYGAASWYVGQRAQDVIESAVQTGNQNLGRIFGAEASTQPMQLSVSRYDRGLFSSHIIYSLKIVGQGGAVTEYLLGDRLEHGPFPLSAVRQGQFAPMLALSRASLVPNAATQAWFDSHKGDKPLDITTRVGFSGAGSTQATFAPVEHTSPDGMQVSFAGGDMTIEFSSGLDSATTRGSFPKLQVTNTTTDESVLVDTMVFDKTYQFAATDRNHVTQFKLNVQRLGLLAEKQEVLGLSDLSVTGNSSEQNNSFDGSARYDIASVAFSGKNLGKFAAGFQVGRLDLQALGALTRQYDDILAEQGLSEDDVPQLDHNDLLRLREHLFEALKSRPSLGVDPVVWDNGDGQSQFSVKADFVRPDIVYIDAPTEDILMQAIGTLDLSFSLNKSMMAKAYSQLAEDESSEAQANARARMLFDVYAGRLQRAGLAAYADGVLSSNIRYQDQQMVVNGQALSVAEFLQRGSLLLLQ